MDDEQPEDHDDGIRSKPSSPEKNPTPGFLAGAWCVFALWEIFVGIDWSYCNPGGFAFLPIGIAIFFALIAVGSIIWEAFIKGKPPVHTAAKTLPDFWKLVTDFSSNAPRTFIVTAIILPIFLWNYYGRYSVHRYENEDESGYAIWYDRLTHQSHRAPLDTGCHDPN